MIQEENVKKFKEHGYVVVKNALSKELVDTATQYALFDEMQDFNPDTGQVLGAHAKYADPLMESLLIKLQEIIEDNTGKKVNPTYSFYRVYRPGDKLDHHKDRQSCEISITVSLGFDYSESDYEWPIYIEGTPCALQPGDLVCYRGIELDHWRDTFDAPAGSWHVQAFLHYVDIDGPFSEYIYDGRDSLGFAIDRRNDSKIKYLNEKTENILNELVNKNPMHKDLGVEPEEQDSTNKNINKKTYIEYT